MPERIKELNEALGDRYRVEREVGAGGMATVYLAQDLKHDRQVALKVFHPEVSSSVGHERFLREVQISARLNHPHILTLIDSGQVGDVLYYVIPYVEGESLRQRIEREGPLDVLDAVGLIGQITAALDYAHEQGVIHRDIKPENILIHRGEAMVSDFGIAVGLEVAKTGRLTTAGVSLGTPFYMSPEQVESDAELDVRSDIYALGCVAHEMLAGEPPFTGTSAQVVLAKILTADPTPLSEIREDVSAEVSEAIVKALARAPEDRFATAGEFGTALHDAILGQLATAGSGRWSDFRWAIAVASIAVFALVGWQLLVQADGRFAELAVEIQELADQRAYESAFASAGQGLPNDLRFEELWNTFSAQVPLIRTEPPGAEVWRRPYDAPDAWESVGTTPVSDLHIPLGMSVLRFELDGWASAEVAIVPASGDTVGVSLQPEGEVPPGMVWVPAGEAAIPNYSWANMELEPYLIDRYEVTNAEFKEFVDSGGYTEASFWTDPLTRGSGTVEWVDAIAGFVDRTGRPGPATWEAGDYRDGSDDLPVRGISWFEARAYAAFRGKELPTAFHWHRAAQVEFASYVVPMSNFGGSATAKVGQYEGLTGWGTYDMAGNVREWVSNASGPERFILGGAWDDFSWLFALAYAADPWNRSEQNGFRLAVYGDSDGLTEAGRALDLSYRDYNAEVPVSDETFEVFRSSYAYDPTPLNADVSEAEVADDWAVERVAFDAAYGDERVLADLYLPRDGRPPYQTVVYMPGSSAITTARTLGDYRERLPLDFILKTGRAVMLPAYDGSLERRDPDLVTSRASETYAHAEFTAHWVKDLRRSVDYLETRADIDSERIAYFGNSWGGRVGAIMLAMEPRLQVGVLVLGGFRPERALPVADDLNFVPRVTQPVVMINGREDHLRPYAVSQVPFFRLLGTAPEDKEHKVFPGGHYVPRADLIRETLLWLDLHLGLVSGT